MTKVVNVAQVPQRSPFRYPGGKTWLIPVVRQWLQAKAGQDRDLVEPYAGGGIITLTAVAEKLVRNAVMAEIDEDVAAVWQTIIEDETGGEWLIKQISNFEMNIENLKAILSQEIISTRQRAFITILKNRVNHGGILAPGAGILKHGELGKGICSRWYPNTLNRRIMEITFIKHRITFYQRDAMQVMDENSDRKDAVYFIDPPYTVAGRRLYKHSSIDHEKLFDIADKLAGDFLITYDNADEIRNLAIKHGFDRENILMKSTHHIKKYELLIGRNLDWIREDKISSQKSKRLPGTRFVQQTIVDPCL
jgi:DNA adenine methylase